MTHGETDLPRELEALRRENARLLRVNAALVRRVEQNMACQGSAFAAFQAAITLDEQVRARTRELEQALGQLHTVNRALEQARRAADDGSRAKSEFLAMMSHEIRTPLNGVIGLADVLRETRLDDEQARLVDGVGRSAEMLLAILNDVLDLSKIEAGRMELDLGSVEVPAVLDSVGQLFAGACAKKGIALSVGVDPGVPLAIQTDPVRLRQVLINLVGNAIKFTPGGSIRIEAVGPAPGRVRFLVRDTGIGISAAQRGRLFQPFTQADGSMSRRFGGTGLGLVISRRLCELMGGGLDVESELGRGSTFIAEIQAEAVTVACPKVEAAPLPTIQAAVLVVDDNNVNQMVAARMLQKLGCTVTVVGDGAEAVEAARTQRFDLVLMDVQMPGMDGLAATRALRGLPRSASVPILALTANALSSDEARCREAGMDGYLSKPIRLDRLAHEVVRLLRPAAVA